VVRFARVMILVAAVMLLWGCAPAKQERQEARTHYALGVSYLREPNVTAALQEFLKVVELDPRNADYQEVLAQAYHLKKAYPEAEKHYLEAVRLSGGDPGCYNNLGALYLDMQRWDDAVEYFSLAAGDLLFAQPEVAFTGAGTALVEKGEPLEAIEYFQQALEKNRRYAPAHLHMGRAYQSLGRPGPAIESFLEATRIDTGYAEAYYQLGLAYMKRKDDGKAREAFEKVISLRPDSELSRKAENYLKLL